ncbi:MAG: fumarylacetoacetate hydrolase family protein [Anaerolineae bacterium]|nr:fumarylacetoacetate hydrolase family protein [Anaerolineae bacterium]
MFLLTFKAEDGLRLGVKTKAGVVDVKTALAALSPVVTDNPIPDSIAAVLRGGQAARQGLADFVAQVVSSGETAAWLLAENSLQFGPCVPDPGKIICIGLNYRRHAAESGMPVPETPVLFSKFSNTIAAPGESIPLPATAKKYDYEVELGVVMGRRARYVSEAEALDYVFGYFAANDVSVRDLQQRTSQWLLGKTLDKFAPIGPYLVTADEVPDPQKLWLRSWINGELRQNSNTADMVFGVAQLISYISQYFALEPGDLIFTGTPEGVAMGMQPPVWLKPGDEMTMEVEKLGKLTNKLVAESGG